MQHLFSPLTAGKLELANRILMAPLTRCRADPQHMPSTLMVEYYRQRASAGLIIAEATMTIEGHSAFWSEPGIYSKAQAAAWRNVTEAVHASGGKIVLQLWHGGRACHPLMNAGATPVAPTALAITNDMLHTPNGKVPYAMPRALDDQEIPNIVAGFKNAASLAKEAGFDGVEIHGANGYLLDEFLRDGSNKRTGPYGGPFENRARLMLEVLEVAVAVWGTGRVGLRISPLNSYNSMLDSDPIGLSRWLARQLNQYPLAYLHVMRADFLGEQKGDVLSPIREEYKGVLIGNMGYTATEAEHAIAGKLLDAVAFGTQFLANPDLPARFKAGSKLNAPDSKTFYSSGAAGYTDYPAL